MKITALIFGILLVSTFLGKEVLVDLTSGNQRNDVVLLDLDKDTMKVVLDENPTTGFQWRMMPKTMNAPQVLEVIEERFIESELYANRMIVGAGGRKEITFKPFLEGSETVELIYCRAWELKRVMTPEGTIDWEKAASEGIEIFP
jgi:predicted secreted protein